MEALHRSGTVNDAAEGCFVLLKQLIIHLCIYLLSPPLHLRRFVHVRSKNL